jgi:hypothetical protein
LRRIPYLYCTHSSRAFQGELSTATWEERTENITFADFTFVLTGSFIKNAKDGETREGSSEEEKEKDEKEAEIGEFRF